MTGYVPRFFNDLSYPHSALPQFPLQFCYAGYPALSVKVGDVLLIIEGQAPRLLSALPRPEYSAYRTRPHPQLFKRQAGIHVFVFGPNQRACIVRIFPKQSSQPQSTCIDRTHRFGFLDELLFIYLSAESCRESTFFV